VNKLLSHVKVSRELEDYPSSGGVLAA